MSNELKICNIIFLIIFGICAIIHAFNHILIFSPDLIPPENVSIDYYRTVLIILSALPMMIVEIVFIITEKNLRKELENEEEKRRNGN